MKGNIRATIKYVGVIVIMLYTGVVSSQKRQLKNANEKYDSYAFIDARKIYLSVVEKGYTSSDLYQKIGDSYYFNAELDKAVVWYDKIVQEFPGSMDVQHLFRYAQALRHRKQYEAADAIMNQYYEASNQKINQSAFAMNTQDYLHFIAEQSGKFRISKLHINSPYSDFAPSYAPHETLVFSSSRMNNSYSKIVHEWNNMPFLNVYTTRLEDNDTLFKPPKAVKGKLNTKFHESSTAFSKDGKTVYFTRNNYIQHKRKTDSTGTILLKLYRATFEGKRWKNIEELPFNSDEYSVAHPALSEDETQLYFASDMPGGQGLSDLYVVDINSDGSFGTPINLGDQINTEGKETFPFSSTSGRLYFASDGHIGLGGLDVFVAIPDTIGFSKPFNIGAPINSSADDFTFIIKEHKKTGYFASNRSSAGIAEDNIYSFTQIDTLITQCTQQVKGRVLDQKTKTPLAETVVMLINEENTILESMLTGPEGDYSFSVACKNKYRIEATKKEYIPSEIALSTHDIWAYTYTLDLSLGQDGFQYQEIKVGDDLSVALGVNPIYFDLGESYITKEAEIELQKIIETLREYPNLRIAIRSHTDSRASAAYNMQLSNKRAKSTMRYILKNGNIDKERVTAEGYGESVLLNKCADGVPCTAQQHQQNRRSEFIVLE